MCAWQSVYFDFFLNNLSRLRVKSANNDSIIRMCIGEKMSHMCVDGIFFPQTFESISWISNYKANKKSFGITINITIIKKRLRRFICSPLKNDSLLHKQIIVNSPNIS